MYTLSFSLAPAGFSLNSSLTTASDASLWCIAAMCNGSLPPCEVDAAVHGAK